MAITIHWPRKQPPLGCYLTALEKYPFELTKETTKYACLYLHEYWHTSKVPHYQKFHFGNSKMKDKLALHFHMEKNIPYIKFGFTDRSFSTTRRTHSRKDREPMYPAIKAQLMFLSLCSYLHGEDIQ